MIKKNMWLCLVAVLFAAHCAQAETTEDSDQYPLIQHNAQMGVDVWRLSPERPVTWLNMANNSAWRYRPESPWGTFEGHLTIHKNMVLTLKARADQSMGTHVDELSADWAYSPSFGFRAGVLSYKTSWCQTYNVDSPWVKENDPFCTSQNASEASGGAPGLQVYANTGVGDYRAQAILGMYRPRLFNYNTTEFSNLRYANSHIDLNNKNGASISILDTSSATEWRIGLLGAKQSLLSRAEDSGEVDRVKQTYGIVFAGVSFYVAAPLNVRLQTLRHNMTASRWSPDGSVWPHYKGGNEVVRRSDVAELNYQYSVQDVLAFAISRYSFDSTSISTNYPALGYTRFVEVPYVLTGVSASWRHDWQKGMYTSIQWAYNKGRAAALQNMDPSTTAYRGAHGVGLRLAYQF